MYYPHLHSVNHTSTASQSVTYQQSVSHTSTVSQSHISILEQIQRKEARFVTIDYSTKLLWCMTKILILLRILEWDSSSSADNMQGLPCYMYTASNTSWWSQEKGTWETTVGPQRFNIESVAPIRHMPKPSSTGRLLTGVDSYRSRHTFLGPPCEPSISDHHPPAVNNVVSF